MEFEKDTKEEDPFGLDEFLKEAKSSSKKPLDKIGQSGHMHAASARGLKGADEGGSSSSREKRRIDFQSAGSSSSSSSSSKDPKKHKN